MSDSIIPLADVIQQLRAELLTATEAGAGQPLRFDISNLKLELQVVVTKGATASGDAKAGVKFWVLNAETSGKVQATYETSRMQKVTLELIPKTAAGENVPLAG